MEKVNEGDREYRGGDSGVKYLFRGPKLDWGVILLKPGERLGEHLHREVEETFYILKGTPMMFVNGQGYRTSAGDAFRIEAPDRHCLDNDTAEEAKVVFIKTPYLPDDKENVE